MKLNNRTTNRITSSTLGGALTVLLLWGAELKPDPEVVVAFTIVVNVVVQVLWRKFDLARYLDEEVPE